MQRSFIARQICASSIVLSLCALSALAPGACADSQPSPPLQYGAPAGNALDEPNSPETPVPPQQQTEPAPTPTIAPGPQIPLQPQPRPENPSAIDLTSAILGKLEMELDNAQFMDAAVDKLHVIVSNLDMKDGSLKGLNINVHGAQFRDMAFDQLMINAQGDMNFDRNELVANRVLQFRAPAQAEVTAIVSQDSLNRWLNSPVTLQRLSGTANQKVRLLAGMLGGGANVGVTLSDASVALEKGNRVNIGMKANVGMGGMGLPIPLQLDTKLGLNEGWINLSDTHLITNGQEISPFLSNMLVKHLNEMTDWGKSNQDMQFSFSQLKVVPNKQFIVKGTAQITRLRFGQHQPATL